jgi:hypothetical protein
MKILVVEEYSHPKVLENTCHLFLKNGCSVTVYRNKSAQPYRELTFLDDKQGKEIINKFHSTTFFIGLLFLGRPFDYINISTGPECNSCWEVINVIFFYICCIVYGKKIILTIKSIRPYLKTTRGLFSYIRSRAVRHLVRFVFETETMGRIFKKDAEIITCHIGSVYDRYTDLLDPKLLEKTPRQINGKTRIGLTGVIDTVRRDYGILIEVLKQLSIEECAKLKLVTLGACFNGRDNEIIRQLTKYVEVDVVDGWISAEGFDNRGLSCDVLIAPLKEELEYGTYKGSGAFGDAVYLKKNIILPAHVDRENEFQEIALYYRNSKDLLIIFKQIKELSINDVSDSYYEQFSTRNVFKKLMIDLKMNV